MTQLNFYIVMVEGDYCLPFFYIKRTVQRTIEFKRDPNDNKRT